MMDSNDNNCIFFQDVVDAVRENADISNSNFFVPYCMSEGCFSYPVDAQINLLCKTYWQDGAMLPVPVACLAEVIIRRW